MNNQKLANAWDAILANRSGKPFEPFLANGVWHFTPPDAIADYWVRLHWTKPTPESMELGTFKKNHWRKKK